VKPVKKGGDKASKQRERSRGRGHNRNLYLIFNKSLKGGTEL